LQEAHFITGSGRAIEMLHLQAPLAGCWGEPVGAANYSRFTGSFERVWMFEPIAPQSR
jgi:hypothetical protein